MYTMKGIYAPVATPFESGRIAYDRLGSNIDFLLTSKLEGIVVMGSNGEFVSLTEAEKCEMIRFCCKKVSQKKKVMVGIGSNCMNESLRLAEESADQGADAVLVVTPYYYKTAMNDSALEQYYIEIAEQSLLPVAIYNMPANTGVNTSAALLSSLSKHENIVGVKDTSGNIVQIAETIRDAAKDFSVFAGNWAFFLPSLFLGAKGATLALANILPNDCASLMELYEQKRFDEARALSQRLMRLNAAITSKYGIGGLKAAMEMAGLYGGEPRLPLQGPGSAARAEIRQILQNAGVIS